MLPILWKTNFFILYSYPLLMGIAWGLGYQISKDILEKKNIALKNFSLLFWGVFVSSWIGAKIFFLLTSSYGLNSQLTISSSFWLGGGFVFYGGLIFALIFLLFYCLFFKKFDLKNLAFLIPGLSIGHAIGRLGCFMAGCCYGSHCELPWAVNLHEDNRHPVQLYEALALLLLGFYFFKKIKNNESELKLITLYLGFYSFLRFSLEFFRGDLIRGVYWGLSSSQWISLVVFLLSFLIFFFYQRNGNFQS